MAKTRGSQWRYLFNLPSLRRHYPDQVLAAHGGDGYDLSLYLCLTNDKQGTPIDAAKIRFISGKAKAGSVENCQTVWQNNKVIQGEDDGFTVDELTQGLSRKRFPCPDLQW